MTKPTMRRQSGASCPDIVAVTPTTYSTCGEQLLQRKVLRFRGGLVFKAHRLCITGWKLMKKDAAHGRQLPRHGGRHPDHVQHLWCRGGLVFQAHKL